MDMYIRTALLSTLLFFAGIKVSSAAIVIDFSTGLAGTGGTITESSGDVVGSDILIGALTVDGTPSMDGVYVTDALLNFDTSIDMIEIVGDIPSLGITSETLLSGSFIDFTYTSGGFFESFEASGPDSKSDLLLSELGVPTTLEFLFYGFSIESLNGTVISTDIVNTAVPIPASLWLFASGLVGLVGVSRRKV